VSVLTGQTDGQTDGRTSHRYITLSAMDAASVTSGHQNLYSKSWTCPDSIPRHVQRLKIDTTSDRYRQDVNTTQEDTEAEQQSPV